MPEDIIIEGRACWQLDNNAELYKLALEHNEQYLADLSSSYKDVTVRKGGYLGSFKTDKGTVEVYDSAIYGRPAEIDNNVDSETGFTGKVDEALECYDYSLFFRTMRDGKCIDSVNSAFPAAFGTNPSNTPIEIRNRLYWSEDSVSDTELLKQSGITLMKTDDYYAVATIRRTDLNDYRDALTTSYYSGKDNALLLSHNYIDVRSNNGYTIDDVYYGPDGKKFVFSGAGDALKKLDSGDYLANSGEELTIVSWNKFELTKDLTVLNVMSDGISESEDIFLATSSFLIPVWGHSEPGGGLATVINIAFKQKGVDVSDEQYKKRSEQYLAELRAEYKDVPVHRSGLLTTVQLTDDTTVEVYESAVYGRPLNSDFKKDAANGYTYTGVDDTIECYDYTVIARVLKDGKFTAGYDSTCYLYSDNRVEGGTADLDIWVVNNLLWSYKYDYASKVTSADLPNLDSLPWAKNDVIDAKQPYIAAVGIIRRFTDGTEGYSMHAYYYYYNIAYYLGSATTPILSRCNAEELFSYQSLGERITDSDGKVIYTESRGGYNGAKEITSSGDGFGQEGKTVITTEKVSDTITETWEKQPLNSEINLFTFTRRDSGLGRTYVYSYLSCADNNLVAFDMDLKQE